MANPNGSNTFPFGGSIQIAAGTAIIGTVDIDQTTPGSTNAISLAQVGSTTLAAPELAGRVPTSEPDVFNITPVAVTTATTIFSVDTTGFASIAVQVTSVGSSNTVVWEQSNDNTNWVGKNLIQDGVNNGNTSFQNQWLSGNNQLSGSIHFGPATARYFRARVATFGSGTVTAGAYLRRGAGIVSGGLTTQTQGDGFGSSTAGVMVLDQNYAFNGNGWDRTRNNIDAAALITLTTAGATTVTSTDQTNYNGRGLQIGININTSTVPSLVVSVQGKDAASGVYYTMLTSTTIATTGFTNMVLYPGITATTNVASLPLPRTWRLQAVNGTNTLSATLGASVIL